MRVIGKLNSERKAQDFVHYLLMKQIEANIEHVDDLYYVWAYDEDRLEEAVELLKHFEENPDQIQIEVPRDPISLGEPRIVKVRKIGKAPLTKLLIFVCVVLYLISLTLKAEPPFGMNALSQWLIFEMPTTFPFWQGIYPALLSKMGIVGVPVFTQILDGQVWRLITPIFLHFDFLHILFNMLWLWLLGRQVEERLGIVKFVILMLVAAVVSNTTQYLMSGPFFIGFSGVVCALAAYIWIRQKKAPWEGYPLPHSTIVFLFIFVFGMVGLQLLSFILSYTGIAKFPINIANTAHVAGGLVGYLFGKFGWRRK
ncbi:MAG: Rhomboid protease GlpG [Chlamydiia bacterium]|nr:Rhomboid protease GlpG [Chlamydiia bacterium]MCH9616602.1 Rhomboid protease GlpG [Chlamydiia bacterium]MCH9629332.1 Rhomboid protease GlpG [Chlamydiia bacterium]